MQSDNTTARPGIEEVRRTITRTVSEVEAKAVEWLWPGYFPLGALCLIDGDPGLGKSFFTLDIAARVSSGGVFPSGERATPAGVVLLSFEDDPGVTIRPRLENMGADLDRVVLLEGVRDKGKPEHPRLPTVADITAIRQTVREVGATLVIIDPLMAALPSETDSHSDHNIRTILAPLGKLAIETGATILVVRHLNKSAGGNALYRGGGSIGIVAAARAAYLVAKDPKEATRRVLACTKLNIAAEPGSLQYRIAVNGEGKPFLSWEGESDYKASDLLQPERQSTRDKSDSLKDFLTDRLKDGPVAADTLRTEVESLDISWRTAKRIKTELGIVSFREGGSNGTWFWSLKGGHEPTNEGGHAPIHKDVSPLEEESPESKDCLDALRGTSPDCSQFQNGENTPRSLRGTRDKEAERYPPMTESGDGEGRIPSDPDIKFEEVE